MDTTQEFETTPLLLQTSILKNVTDARKPHEKNLAVYLVLASVLFERIAFYSLAANLVLTLQSSELQWHSQHSLTASYIFFGTSYISTILFAIISDAKLLRAKTIIIGFIPYLIGYILINLISNTSTHSLICPNTSTSHKTVLNEHCGLQIIGVLIIIAVGAGAVKSNMAVFGAEQVQGTKLKSRYFDKYIVAVNIGGIIATLAIPYVQKNDQTFIFIGYLAAAILLFISAILFVIGYRFYIHIEPYDTVVVNFFPVFYNALQRWYRHRFIEHSNDTNEYSSLINNRANSRDSVSEEEPIKLRDHPSSFLDYAKLANKGKYHDRIVNDVKTLGSAISVFILLIPYWLIYNQIQTTFPEQGQQMNVPLIGSEGEIMPVIWMSLGDPIAIIIGIIILNVFVYKHLDAENRDISMMTKFVIGIVFAIIAMSTAGVVEHFRQVQCPSIPFDMPTNVTSNLTVFAQLPQNVFMGLAELFATVASYEFAYYAAPRSAQSLFMSLRFCSVGVSSFLGTGYIYIFPTPQDTLNFSCSNKKQWSFYTYFFSLAGIQFIFLLIFIILQKRFRIVKRHPQHNVS